MKKNIESFPNQLIDQFSIINNLKFVNKKISSVLIVGQGGSSIGGLLLSDLLKKDIKFPIIINHGYKLPNWVNSETLIIVSSYSGNTEETLSVLKFALKKKLKPICVSSGGKLLKLSKEKKLDFLLLPMGFQPREALAYSIFSLFSIFYSYKVISKANFLKLKKASIFILNAQSQIIKKAKLLANSIYKKTPILYSSNLFLGAVTRFKQQLNENSKNICWFNIIPEMNHNEIVGWANINKEHNFFSIFIKSNLDLRKNQKRIDLTLNYLKQKNIKTELININNGNLYDQYLFLINLFDFTSYFLSLKNKVDPYNIDSILMLKSKLN